MAIRDDVKVIARSWRQHLGLQFATALILTATFSVVIFMLSLSFNFQRVLTVWGEQVQISAYLEDGISDSAIASLQKDFESRPEVASVTLISKVQAADLFRDQMASYAPDLMSDSEFATPFPASLQIRMREDRNEEGNVANLEALALELGKKDGVEDVSYGQSWVRNYASFVGVIKTVGLVFGLILLFGSIFIIANSIRTHISGRREEIEILELIGATQQNIRRPYIAEGILLCTLSAVAAMVINGVFYSWQIALMKKSLAFARMAQEFSFLSAGQIALFCLAAATIGGVGSWLTVRSLNDGWSAARGVRA